MPTDTAPDLTLTCKSATLAAAFATILDEGRQGYRTNLDGTRAHPSADGREVTIPWNGRPLFLRIVAELAERTGAAEVDEAQAMVDRGTAWSTGLTMEQVVAELERLQAQDPSGAAAEALMASLFGGFED